MKMKPSGLVESASLGIARVDVGVRKRGVKRTRTRSNLHIPRRVESLGISAKFRAFLTSDRPSIYQHTKYL
jgi:hypothetical protein